MFKKKIPKTIHFCQKFDNFLILSSLILLLHHEQLARNQKDFLSQQPLYIQIIRVIFFILDKFYMLKKISSTSIRN